MKRILFKTAIAALGLAALTVCASRALPPAAADDPLVSLSYLTGSYRTGLLSDVDVAVAAAKKQLTADFTAQTASLANPTAAVPATAQSDYKAVALGAGQSAVVKAGGEVLVVSGQPTAAGAGLVDATTGTAVAKGGALAENHLYIASAECPVQAGGECKLLIK